MGNSIKVNRIDTVKSAPESGIRISHSRSFFVEYFSQNDTLLNYQLRADLYIKRHGSMDYYGMVPETDSAYNKRMSHPKYLLGLKIIKELKFNTKTP